MSQRRVATSGCTFSFDFDFSWPTIAFDTHTLKRRTATCLKRPSARERSANVKCRAVESHTHYQQ